MIEQYTITTTPKYNFPQPALDTPLPQRFIELSINSLRQVHQKSPVNQQNIHEDTGDCATPTQIQLKRLPVRLTARHQEVTIAAVDTSTIKIGETDTGIIIAIRGATVWKKNRNYLYQRFGPLIFHITEENKNAVYNNLDRA